MKERDVAVQAALAAGEILRMNLGRVRYVGFKGEVDLVTDVDHRSERCIIEMIRHYFPEDPILAEESASRVGSPSRLWVVDPLDGTTNYAHGYPFVSVSVAFRLEGSTQVGVVYDPLREELFVAERGHGAQLNGSPIFVSRTGDLSKSLLATGFAYNRELVKVNLKHWANFSLRAQGLRRDGSAALDLCYVACGRFDGFWELGLAPWDTAAGALVVEEAGGRVSDPVGKPYTGLGPNIVASNGLIHDEILEVLRLEG